MGIKKLKRLADSTVKDLRQHYGGQTIYIPKQDDRTNKELVKNEYQLMIGQKHLGKKDIVLFLHEKYNLSIRYIYHIIKGL